MRCCLLMLLFPAMLSAQGNVDKPKIFAEYLTKHQLSEADRTKVYNTLKSADISESMMALLILDRHTHSDSIPHLIQFAAKHKGTTYEKEVQKILVGHLFCTEHWQRAVTEAGKDPFKLAALDGAMSGEQTEFAKWWKKERGMGGPVAPAPIIPVSPPNELEISRGVLASKTSTKADREAAIAIVAKSTKLLDLITLKNELPQATDATRKVIAVSLASTKEGADLLFAAAKDGKIPAAVVNDSAVVEKLKTTGVRDLDERLKSLK